MPRLYEVPLAELTDDAIRTRYNNLFDGRDPVAEPGTKTGTAGNWWTVFANSPDTFHTAVAGFNYYLNQPRKVSGKLRELGMIRAGWLIGSQFVYSQHCKAGRSQGLTAEQVKDIHAWQVSSQFDETEKLVLAYTDYVVDQRGRVPDEIFDALKAKLDDEQMLELTYCIGMYSMHAMISKALRLEYDDVDDRVVEIPAPGTASDANFMAMEER